MANYYLTFIYVQELANCLLFLSVNMAGIFTHYPTETAQRAAFLEARTFVESRLTIQKQTEEQVKVYSHFSEHSKHGCTWLNEWKLHM